MSAIHTEIQKLKNIKTDSNGLVTKKRSTRCHHLNETHSEKKIPPLPPAREIFFCEGVTPHRR